MSSPKTTATNHAKATTTASSNHPLSKGESPVKTTKTPVPKAPAAGSSELSPTIAAAPTASEITSLLDQLDEVAVALGPGASALTIAQRRLLLKIRPGGETHAVTAVGLADRYGLTIPGVTSAEVAADVALVKDLAPLISRFDSLRGLVMDMSLQAQSRLWGGGTTAYSMLLRLRPAIPGAAA